MALPLSISIIVVAIVFSAVALAAVCLRFCARMKQKAGFGIDDYMMIPGCACAIGIGMANIVSASYGHLGKHIEIGPDGPIYGAFMVTLLKASFVTELLSIVSLACTKSSIVLFYRRIFRGEVFSVISMIVLVLVFIWGVGCFFAQLFDCTPIAANWDKSAGGRYGNVKCFDPLPMFYSVAASDLLIDCMILILPQPLVWKLHMPIRKKAAVSAIFLLGAFIVGVSAARIFIFVDVGREEGTDLDKSYFIAPVFLWTQLECAIAVLCACLPTLGTIFSSISPERVLKSWASKISLRTAHSRGKNPQSSEQLPRWDDAVMGQDGSGSFSLGEKGVIPNAVIVSTATNPYGHPSCCGNSIYIHNEVYQEGTETF